MPTYNFRKETKLYVVRGNTRYAIDIYPDLTFSQTFDETSVPVKTLHSQFDMFENAVITKANPANFSFTMPILLEKDSDVVLDLLLDYDPYSNEATLKTADLYMESNSEVYKLEKAVFESGTFMIQKEGFILLSVSGTAKKLEKSTKSYIPGVLQERSETQTYSYVNAMSVNIDDSEQSYITAVTMELKNNVEWVDFATIQNSIGISDASGTVSYPEVFVVGSRTLSGTIQQYVTDETNKVNRFNTNSSISVKVGQTTAGWALEFNLPSAVFTNRLDPQDVFIQSYDFRMTSSPIDLSESVLIKTSI